MENNIFLIKLIKPKNDEGEYKDVFAHKSNEINFLHPLNSEFANHK